MKKFDDQFKAALRESVQEVEAESSVELVVAVLPRVQRYLHVPLLTGSLLSLVVFTILMFINTEFWYVHIYIDTIAAFLFGMGLIWVFPSLGMMMVGKRETARHLEIHARSMFQKAGIHETRHRTGMLIVFSWLERQAVIVADRGVSHAIPPAELDKLRQQASDAIQSKDAAQAILELLESAKPMFTALMPQQMDDINELPDELWLD